MEIQEEPEQMEHQVSLDLLGIQVQQDQPD